MISFPSPAFGPVLLGALLLVAGCASQNGGGASTDPQIVVLRPWSGELPAAARSAAVLRVGHAELSPRLLGEPGLAAGDRVAIHLFDGEVITAAVEEASADRQGVRQVRARLLEPHVGVLLLSTLGDTASGNLVIDSDGRAFRLRHDASSGRHFLAQVDPSAEDVLPGSPPMQP
jgi:hypothetical protein